jgi:hypothetical protein
MIGLVRLMPVKLGVDRVSDVLSGILEAMAFPAHRLVELLSQ